LKKITKKLLLLKVRWGKSATATKSFLLLFFKKEDLSLASCLHPIALTF